MNRAAANRDSPNYQLSIVNCQFRSEWVENNAGFLQGTLHIDDALVGTATEHQVAVLASLQERAVDKYVYQLEECPLARVAQQLLKGKARVAPYILIGTRAYGLCQFGKPLRLIHGIATREGDVGIRIGLDDTHNLFGCHRMTARKVPRLWVMASRAGMATARTIDGSTETRPVDHRVLYDA